MGRNVCEDNIYEEVAKRLKEERIRQNMDIKQLSLLSGVNRMAISRYEEGMRKINCETFIRIALVLDIDIKELFPYKRPHDYASERFEYLMRNQDIRSINFIFDIVRVIINYNEKNNSKLVS